MVLEVGDVLINENDSNKTLTIDKITKSRKVSFTLYNGEVVKNVKEKKDEYGYYQTYKREKYYKNKLDKKDEPPPYQAPPLSAINIEEIGGLSGNIFQNIMKFTTFNDPMFQVGDILYPIEKGSGKSQEESAIKVLKSGKTLEIEDLTTGRRTRKIVKEMKIDGKVLKYIPYERRKYTKYQNFTNFPSLEKFIPPMEKSGKKVEKSLPSVEKSGKKVEKPLPPTPPPSPIEGGEDLDKLIEDFFPFDELEADLEEEELEQLKKDLEIETMGEEDINVAEDKEALAEYDDFFDEDNYREEVEKEAMGMEDIDAPPPIPTPPVEVIPPTPITPSVKSADISSAESSSVESYSTQSEDSIENAYDSYLLKRGVGDDIIEFDEFKENTLRERAKFQEKIREGTERSKMAEEDINIVEPSTEEPIIEEPTLQEPLIEEQDVEFFPLNTMEDFKDAIILYKSVKNKKKQRRYKELIEEFIYDEDKFKMKLGTTIRELREELEEVGYVSDDDEEELLLKKIRIRIKKVIDTLYEKASSSKKKKALKRIKQQPKPIEPPKETEEERIKRLFPSMEENLPDVEEEEEKEEEEEPTEAVKQVEEFLRLEKESSVQSPPTPPIKTQKEIEDADALRQVEEFLRLQREQETAPTPTPKPTSKPTFIRPEAMGRIRGKKEIAKAIAMLNYFSKQDKKPPYYRSLAKSIITYTKKEYPTYDSSYIDVVLENVPIIGKNLSRRQVDDILIDEALVLIKTTLKGDRDDSIKIVSSNIDLESERAMKKIKNKLGDEGAFNNIERFIRKDVRVADFDKSAFMRKNIEEIKTTQFLRREGLSLPPMEKKKSEDSDDSDESMQEFYWDD